MFHKEITIPIYESTLNLVIVENDYEYKYIYAAEKHFSDEIEDNYGKKSFAFFNVIYDVHTICINKHTIDKEKASISNTIAHEAFHYVCHLFEGMRMFLNSGSEEAYAYLLGYIVEQIDIFMKEYEIYKEEYIANDLEYIIENVNELNVYDLLQKLIFWALDGPLLSSKMLQKLSEGEDELLVKKEIIELMKNVS